jgi:phosphoglycerate dehydrogenase-like enzyme
MRNGPYERGVGVSLWGKTLGIVGLGNIGKAVARRARGGFDMKILATTPRPDAALARRHEIEIVPLDELLRRSDFVSLHVRLNGSTTGMIGARELALMKPSAFLINTARQELVDEAAMTDAVVSGRIAGAAVDDPPRDKASPLLRLPNFVCTPHLGNRAVEGMVAVFRSAVAQAVTVIRGGRPGACGESGGSGPLSLRERDRVRADR